MRPLSVGVCCSLVLLVSTSPAFGGVEVSMRGGRISIVATQATAGEILAEWAKLGQVKVVNPEFLSSERLTIELHDVTEEQALAVVLRHASGWVAAPRETVDPDLSRFDRLLVMRRAAPVPVRIDARAPNVRPADPDEVTVDADADDQPDPDSAEPPSPLATPRALEAGGAPVPGSAGRRPGYRAPVTGGDPDRTASEDEPPAWLGPNQASIGAAAVIQQPTARPAAPPRPFTAGQVAERVASMPQRDPRPAAPRPPEDASQVNPMFDDTQAPAGPVTIPAEDPVAQAMFKARRAVETVDPRTFDFKMPKTGAMPGTAGAQQPSAGTAVPGKAVPMPPKTAPIIK